MLTTDDLDLSSIDAVIFDLDGTLYDKSSLARRLVTGELGRLGMFARERVARERMRGVYYGTEPKFYKTMFEIMAEGQPYPPSVARAWYMKDYMPTMVRTLKVMYKAEPWALQMLNELREAGKKVAIYSDYGSVHRKLQALGISPSMADIIISAPELGGLKPARESMLKLLNMLGVTADRTLMIGDRDDTDGESARAVGAHFLQVDNTKPSKRVMIKNKRYDNLLLKQGTYVPDMGIDYPEDDPVARLFKAEYIHDFPVDENYPFVDDRFAWRLKQKLYAWPFVLHTVVGGMMLRIKMGLRYEGRDVLKRYKKEFAGGIISLSNHCYFIDCPAVLMAIKAKYTVKIPMFAPNFRTKNRDLMLMVGGIPIPPAEAGLSAMKKFNEAFDTFHERGYSFHIFPEAAQWPFYKPLRPFQKGAFTMSYKYGMPLLPCVVTYRKRTGIYRLFGPKNMPLLTVKIGEPIFPDKTQPRKVEVDRLRELAHKEMEELAGIVQNSWPIVPEAE